MSNTRLHIAQIIKYGISGASGGLLQLLFLYIFVDLLNWWYLHGVVCAYLIALIIVFSLQKFWTFRDYSMNTFRRQSLLYLSIAIIAFALNVIFMYILVDLVHISHIGAQVIVVGVVGILTFLFNKTFTFRGEHKKNDFLL